MDNRLAAVAILSIEAPSFVAFLSFARGIGRFIEGKPNWFKAAIYAVYLSFHHSLHPNECQSLKSFISDYQYCRSLLD